MSRSVVRRSWKAPAWKSSSSAPGKACPASAVSRRTAAANHNWKKRGPLILPDPNSLQDMANRDFRDLASEEFDTRTLLRNAANQAIDRKYEDFLIVDTDSHHYETEAFKEIAEYIEDPVMRYEAKFQGHSRGGFTAETGSYQEIARSITRYPRRKNEKVPSTKHRDLTLMERWMDAMGVDMAVMFPTPMLNLSNCPR